MIAILNERTDHQLVDIGHVPLGVAKGSRSENARPAADMRSQER